MKNFLAFGALLLPLEYPIIAHYIIILIFPAARTKAKISVKILHCSEIFSLIFHIFNNFNPNFWKISPYFRASPKSKILSRPSENGPPDIWLTPSTEKSCMHYWIRNKGNVTNNYKYFLSINGKKRLSLKFLHAKMERQICFEFVKKFLYF